MRTRCVRHWVPSLLLLLSTLLAPLLARAAGAQEIDTVRRELEAVRRQLDAIREQYEGRLRELTGRLEQLERDGRAAPVTPAATGPGTPTGTARTATAPAASGSTPAAATPAVGSGVTARAEAAPAGDSPTLGEMLTPRQPFALAQPGRALLFDIGVSGDFVGNATSVTRERRRDGTFAGRENRFFPREVELGLFGRVDPYASAVVRLSAGEEPAGLEPSDRSLTVSLDEANLTLLTLPFGTTARLGVMRPRFGTLNSVHQDDLPQVDRPNVLTRFFGEEQLDGERGVEAFWVLPTSIFHELALGVFDGDNEVAFGRGSLNDPMLTARWRTFFELEDAGGLQLDLSATTGITADDHRNTVLGLGAKYKWSGGGSGFPLVTLAAEALYGMRSSADDRSPTGLRRFDHWGAYLYAQYDWTRRWAAGVRGDWTELPAARGHEWALSPYLQFKPSEFLRFRLQYKHSEGTGAVQREANELFLQGTFILGAHPTERF
jgi:hypothetical protein